MPLNLSDWDFQGLDSEFGSSDCKGMEKAELGGGGDSVADDDVIYKLPIDPFGMDINSTITITGWFQNLRLESDWDFDGFGVDEDEKEFDDHSGLSAGLNWDWGGEMWAEPELSNVKIGGISIPCEGFDSCGVNTGLVNVEEFMSLGSFGNWDVGKGAQKWADCGETCFDGGEGGAPHDAMFFALAYLGVLDLLNVERVCKSLHDGVRSDPLLWRSIHIDQRLSEKITDDALLKLANRAQGTLQCLNLVTDGGLKRVIETNPKMTKLSVPGCIRLSIEGILDNLRTLKIVGSPGIKHLRIGGICRVKDKHFEELQVLLIADNHMQLNAHSPQIYCGRYSHISCDDDRAIDIEACPRCQQLRLVYDCPSESCQGKHQAAQSCRACILCIARCSNCGRCIKDHDYGRKRLTQWPSFSKCFHRSNCKILQGLPPS